MQTAKLPHSLRDEVDRKIHRFLWGNDEAHRKVHHVAQAQLLKPKMMGGLGFKAMRQTNSAFLTKIGWRVLAKKDKLWSKVLRSKNCDGQSDIDMFVAKSNASNT